MGVVTFLDLSLFSGGGESSTKYAPKLVISADTIASPTAYTQVAVSAPDGDVWTISSETEGFTGATGTGSTFVNIRFPENTGETARDIVVTVTGQYGSNSYTITQREPLDVVATYNIDSTGSKQLMRSTSYYQYYTVDEDPTQYTATSFNFQTTGEHVVKYRVKNLDMWVTSSVWSSQKPVALVIPDITISNLNLTHTGLLEVTYYGNDIQNMGGGSLFSPTLTGATLPNFTTIDVYAFQGCSALTTVNATGVTSINNSAFSGCKSLTSVSFPNVTTIGDYAFLNCTSLSAITMPNVTTLGNSAFQSCGFVTITIPSGVTAGTNVLSYCVGLTTCVIGDNCQFGTSTFNNSTSLTSVTIGNNCILHGSFLKGATITDCVVGNDCTIGERCWQGCSGLTSLTIGTGCTFTGFHNFTDCTSLSELTLPEGTVFTVTGQQAYNCTALTALTIDCDVPVQAFMNTYFGAGAVLTIGTGCTSIGMSAFQSDNNIVTVNMPATPLTIEDGGNNTGAFQGCNSITDIDLSHVKYIGSEAFQNCTSLSGITLASDVEYIGAWAFYGTQFGGDFVVPTTCNVIGEGAMRHTNITSLSFATGRTSTFVMGKGMFRECTSLTSVTFNNKVAFVGAADNFSGCTQLQEVQGLVVPEEYIASGGTIALGGNNFNKCTKLKRFNSQVDGEFIIPYGYTRSNKNTFAGNITGMTTLMVPTTFTLFGEGGYSGCTNLNTLGVFDESGNTTAITGTLYFHPGVTEIVTNSFMNTGNGANGYRSIVFANTGNCVVGATLFKGCAASALTLNSNVKLSSATNGFSGSTNLEIVSGLSDSVIPGGLFKSCTSLHTVNSETQGHVILPEGLVSIGNNAFLDAVGITTVDIPSTVVSGGTPFSGTSISVIIARPATEPALTLTGVAASGVLYTPADADYSTWLATLGADWSQETIPA